MAKRHPSLVTLSHDHHHGLALALRLRQGDSALLNDGWTHDRVEQGRRVRQFYESELRPHFQSEEQVLFPLMKENVDGSQALVDALITQHRGMERLIGGIENADGGGLDMILTELGTLLGQHIRSEERELFPMCEEHMPPHIMEHIAREVERIHNEAASGTR
jgi:iron-sulfur cluster repair protein YtfE (RIC family)